MQPIVKARLTVLVVVIAALAALFIPNYIHFVDDTAGSHTNIMTYLLNIAAIGVASIIAVFIIPVVFATIIVAIKRLFGH
ncbi:MAG: hypothetical protein WCO00_10650 [Rhodospirillaceae bacterium]